MQIVTREPRSIAATVRRLRAEREWNQRQLAEAAGLSKRTVEWIEGGKRGAQMSTYGRIARALGVPITELLGEE